MFVDRSASRPFDPVSNPISLGDSVQILFFAAPWSNPENITRVKRGSQILTSAPRPTHQVVRLALCEHTTVPRGSRRWVAWGSSCDLSLVRVTLKAW